MIEVGKRNLTDRHIKTICAIYNVNEGWLRNGSGEMFEVPEDETAAIVSDVLESSDNKFYDLILSIVKIYQTLQPTDQDVIKNFCQRLIEDQKNRKD